MPLPIAYQENQPSNQFGLGPFSINTGRKTAKQAARIDINRMTTNCPETFGNNGLG